MLERRVVFSHVQLPLDPGGFLGLPLGEGNPSLARPSISLFTTPLPQFI
jgi:hypothetical protein